MNNSKNYPLITIITVVLNGEKTLIKTIKSVINQTYNNIEYIIIDGGSTDGTLGIIEKYDDFISYWVTESDDGLYDAMNKGINIGKGDWFYFLNSDDKIHSDDVIGKIANRLQSIPSNTLIVYGSTLLNRLSGKQIIIGKPWDFICSLMRTEMCLPHQGTFHSKYLLSMFDGFDTSFKIAADYKLIMQSIEIAPPVFVDDVLVADQVRWWCVCLKKKSP